MVLIPQHEKERTGTGLSRQIISLPIKKRRRIGPYPFVLFIAFSIIASYAAPLSAADHIILVQAGSKDTALWNGFKKYLVERGYAISTYEAAGTMEKQVETANRINREKAGFMLVLEMLPAERTDALIAVSDAKKGKGMILGIDEVPGSHITQSEELAASIAEQFQGKVKALPLFSLLGIDMPGVFLRLGIQKDKAAEAFGRLCNGIEKYLKRGTKNERERKGERRNPQP